ncbi:MAG: molybdopterin-guanine dinucleotide biosynthesis protein B [Candidatus Bathyarchaeota archaeon]|nr:molybdopterin-guanine dinucleotide biosynthesis protein B [Candidatus Bathyarchaeota archaeon]
MFNRVIVAVVGSSNSGKTTTVEALIRGLTKRGYTVASAKHIPEPEFTIDTEGKDTWRHSKAGASTVLSVAPNELTTIKKVDTTNYSLEQVIAEFPDEIDIIILEGFKRLVGQNMTIPKIVANKTVNEKSEALERYKNILAFIGSIPEKKVETEIPFVDALKEPEKLVELVNNKVAVLVERKRKREEKITIQIDENFLPLGDFVQDIIRNAVLAMVSSLKGVKIKGEEKVSVVIKRLSRG